MYHKNYWTESTNTALTLDKNLRKEYNERNKLRKNVGVFDNDADADSALDYLYAPSNQSKTQGFLKSNGFPSARDRVTNQRLYGVQEEQNRTRGLLRRTTADILKPDITEVGRGFLQGIYGDAKGESEYQNMVINANRRQSDLYDTFRGSQFESVLRPTIPISSVSDARQHVRDSTPDANNELGRTVVRDSDMEYVRPQYFDSKTLASTLRVGAYTDGKNTVAYSANKPGTIGVLSMSKEKNATQSHGKPYYKGHDGCINGQNRNAGVNKLSYGKDIIANNGCELLAVHNALAMKNNQQEFKEIIEVAEKTKGVMWFGGRFGSHPDQLGKLLEHYEQEYTSTTQKEKFNDLLEDGGIYIVSTWNPGSLTIHTVAFSCDSENNIIVYNRYSNKVAPYRYEATEQQTGLDLYLEECGKEIIMYKLK